jgi:branched-chain amino acid transport system substrate-binding protein
MKAGPARALAFAAATLCASSAFAAEKLNVGYMTTLTGPAGLLGEEMVNAFRLGVEHLGGRIGGMETVLVVVDDQLKPQVGVQVAQRLIAKDKVDVIAGLLFTNVSEAVLNAVLPTGQLVVASGGVASQRAGKFCHENNFSVFWNTDTVYEALGSHLKQSGVKRPYLLAMNYQAGKDAMSGFKRGYGAPVAAENYPRLDQSEFSSELTDIRRVAPDALVYFIPGGNGIAFMKQYAQAGLKQDLPLHGMVVQADELTFPAVGDAALGAVTVGNWSPALPNETNRRFVEAFRAKHGRTPTTLGAMAYDNAMLLDAAIRATGGVISDRTRLREALRSAKFDSVRGPFRFSRNHVPIQNFYLNRVAKGADGKLYNELLATVAVDKADSYAADCEMTPKGN